MVEIGKLIKQWKSVLLKKKVDLTIVPVINWQRSEEYNGSLKGWIPPSPNIPDIETAKMYTGLCLLEGTNLSEGRGTYTPFKFLGAPFRLIHSVIGKHVKGGIGLLTKAFNFLKNGNMFLLPVNFFLATLNPFGVGLVMLAFPLVTVFMVFILRLLLGVRRK